MEKRKTNLTDHPASIDPDYYRPAGPEDWQGRNDGAEAEHRRWHQAVRRIDLTESEASAPSITPGSTVLLGFSCDEGVRRNKGRPGAAAGPTSIRSALANLPFHDTELKTELWDAGDMGCPDGKLEEAQEQLGLAVSHILARGGRPIVLGGGHEVTFGHYLGLQKFLSATAPETAAIPRLGLINFDAHFDNRQPGDEGASSGTGFWQIEQQMRASTTSHVADHQAKFPYLALGIQSTGNTRILFDRAEQSGAVYITADELRQTQPYVIPKKLETFLQQVDYLYLTIDLDVFAAAFAPGVSAPTPFGLLPDQLFFNCLDTILDSGKVLSMDVAELNPSLDEDNRTAKLAAALISYMTGHRF